MIEPVHIRVKGRIRYRVDGLHRSHAFKVYLESALRRKQVVRRASANHITGTVLILYDPHQDPGRAVRALRQVVSQFLREGPDPEIPRPTREPLPGAEPLNDRADRWSARVRPEPGAERLLSPEHSKEAPKPPTVRLASVVSNVIAPRGEGSRLGRIFRVLAGGEGSSGARPQRKRKTSLRSSPFENKRNGSRGDPIVRQRAARDAGLRGKTGSGRGTARTPGQGCAPAIAPAAAVSRGRHALAGGIQEQPEEIWYLLEAKTALAGLESSLQTGLSQAVAEQRLALYGPNRLAETARRSRLGMFLDQFRSLPVALLGAAAGLALVTAAPLDALVIGAVVLINAVIGYKTESEADRTIQSLKSLVRPTAQVLREGRIREISAEGVARGDLLVLKPGTYVTADCRLLESHLLSIDESALTGESLPVQKSAAALTSVNLPLADRVNMAYMGTMVTGGQGLGLVVATGGSTEIGKLQKLVGEATHPETPIERELRRIGNQLVFVSLSVCGLVLVIGLLRGAGLLQMLKTAISLAVAAVPEGLPTVATTTMAIGIRNMKKHQVLIRNLEAVPTLGAVQTICLDKTGTITYNRMSVVRILAGVRSLRVAGGRFLAKEGPVAVEACPELTRLLEVGVLCSETEVRDAEEKIHLNGSSTENSLLQAALDSGLDIVKLRRAHPLLHTRHRAENRNFMCTYHRTGAPGSPVLEAVKGSPAEVLDLCRARLVEGREVPLTEEDRLEIEAENDRLAGEALRVLGLAYRLREDNGDLGSPEDLVWLGLIGMADPIREGVRELVAAFHAAGLDTIMITGDQSPTAYAVGRELNLSRDESLKILDSSHLADVDPVAMEALARRVNVFSRVSPAHKLEIVRALQQAGRIVAMTGDGINDGPALKAADIGIAMGHSGTDIAREIADVVLENDELATLLIAIRDGRTILDNIRKTLHFLLSTNFSEILVMLFGTALGLGHPLNTMQLLWINLLSDIFPGLALALEPPEPRVLNRPPRDPREPILQPARLKRLGAESLVLSTGAMAAYGYGLLRYGGGPRAGTLAFQGLTLAQILHALACRTETSRLRRQGEPLAANPQLRLAVGGSLALQVLTLLIPGLRRLLGTTPLGLADAATVAAGSFLPLLVNEGTKPAHKEVTG